MTTALALRQPRPGLLRQWLGGWLHVVFLVLNLLTGLVALVITLLIMVGAIGLVAAGAGLLVLVPALWSAWLFARAELGRVEAFTGRGVTPRRVDGEPQWLRALGFGQEHRRAAAYTGLHVLWGLLTGALTASALATIVSILTLPLYADRLPEQGTLVLGVVPVGSGGGGWFLWCLALVALVAAPFLARVVTQVDIQVARSLVGQDPEQEIAELSERVESLTTSRSETVDSVEAERRRIERDLHDGPQQRLVAIAMDLGMARQRLAHDPEGAQDLLDKAHQASKEAIVEMRHVARGITPPILADRGLNAAVSALAARSAVPVTVEVTRVDRLDPTTEAIGYYCVSELLTNVAKHARAEHARVRLALNDTLLPPALVIEVTDDGVGGADAHNGTGLVGLRQRVTSVDGTITVNSPPGGPTTALIHLPLRAREVPARPGTARSGTGPHQPRTGIPTPDPTKEETR